MQSLPAHIPRSLLHCRVDVGGKSGKRRQRRGFKAFSMSASAGAVGIILVPAIIQCDSEKSLSGLSPNINKMINNYVVIRRRSIKRNWVPSCQVTFFMNQKSCGSWQTVSCDWRTFLIFLRHPRERKHFESNIYRNARLDELCEHKWSNKYNICMEFCCWQQMRMLSWLVLIATAQHSASQPS